MARQLYDYWFVQFDFPDENGRPYKSSGGQMVWNEKLKREIPEGWEVAPISSWMSIKSGYPFKSETYNNSGKYRIITIKNVQDGYIDASNCDFLDVVPNDIKDYIQLKKGDCLISLTGNCGRIGIVYEDNLLLNQRVGLLHTEVEYKYYSVLLFLSKRMRSICKLLSNGAAQANLSPIDICKVQNIIPNKSILEIFNTIVSPIFTQILISSEETIHLTKQRDELLPLLMNGQVSVMPSEVNCDLFARLLYCSKKSNDEKYFYKRCYCTYKYLYDTCRVV